MSRMQIDKYPPSVNMHHKVSAPTKSKKRRLKLTAKPKLFKSPFFKQCTFTHAPQKHEDACSHASILSGISNRDTAEHEKSEGYKLGDKFSIELETAKGIQTLQSSKLQTMKAKSTSSSKSTRLRRWTSQSKLRRKVSLWDLLAIEIKHMILIQCDILTQYLNGLLTESQIKFYTSQIWNSAIEYDFRGDFHLLPASGFPTINTGLEKVTFKRLYRRLCKFRPDLAATEKFQTFIENSYLWWWTDVNDDNASRVRSERSFKDWYRAEISFKDWYQALLDMDSFLIHVPMRQGWSDELCEFLKLDKIKMLIFTGCRGHLKLFKKSMTEVFRFCPNFGMGNKRLHTACKKILEVASEWGYLDIIKELVEKPYNYYTDQALASASKNAHLEVVKFLSSLETTHLLGGFLSASTHGHADLVTFFLGFYGTSRLVTGEWNNMALINACENDHQQVVSILLQVPSISPSARDNKPIRMACKNGHTEVVKLLLETGRVDARALNDYAFRSAAANGHVSVVRLLLQVPNVNVSANDDEAFRYACKNGKEEVVELLLKTGRVDPAAKNNEGIVEACKNGHLEVVKLLLKVPDVNVTVLNNQPFRYAVQYGYLDVVKVLLDVEIVRARAKRIWSEVFCHSRQPEMLQLLLECLVE
ncbi:hypothetical protein HDU76_010791 [Blyttiomyces sp. JEL0837]|nr:hypothetical protein HDU76_010791 [Blyttiomyces sp. JEL0837]